MPLYEYICGKCKEVTEVIQSFKEGPLKICPHCGSKKLRKLASAPAIQFKGSGWYVTDYGGKSGEKGSGKSEDKGGETSGQKAGASEKSESKPESKESKGESKTEEKGSSKKDTQTSKKSPKKD
jgi:putative FmdB family regulatory protein